MEKQKSIFREGTRTERIFKTLADFGPDGVQIKDLIENVQDQCSGQDGVASDVRAKLSIWTDPDKNPHAKKFMVVTDKEPKIGRPKKDEPQDRQVAIIQKGEPVPAWASWSKANVEIPWTN